MIDGYSLPCVTRSAAASSTSSARGARSPERRGCRRRPPARPPHPSVHTNRGVLLTPFHNMALMSPATAEEDVDRHTEVFGELSRASSPEDESTLALESIWRADMQITRNGIETAAGPSEWFTGTVYLDQVATPSGTSRLSASSVHHAGRSDGTRTRTPNHLRDGGRRPRPAARGADRGDPPRRPRVLRARGGALYGAARTRFMTHLRAARGRR